MAMIPEKMSKTFPDPVYNYLLQKKGLARRFIGVSVVFYTAAGALTVVGAWYLSQAVTEAIFFEKDRIDILPLMLLVVGLYAVKALCVFFGERFSSLGAEKVKQSVRVDLLDGLRQLIPLGKADHQSGSVLNTYVEGVEALQGFYMKSIPSKITAIILPLLILIAVVPFDFMSAFILAITAPLIPVFMIWIGKGVEILTQRQWRRMSYMGGRFFDILCGLTTLKMFNASWREIQSVKRIGDHYRQDTMAILRVAFLSSLVMEFFATISIALIAVLIGFRLLWGHMEFQEAFFILLLAPEFYHPLRRMGADYHAKMEAIGACEKIVELLPKEKPAEGKVPLPEKGKIDIEFRSVCFSYDKDNPILTNVSFVIKAGEKIALAGPSGSGKSTILALVLGFIKPVSGVILINGVDLQTIDHEEWWRHVGWVGQRPYLASGMIDTLIRQVNPSLSVDEAQSLLGSCGLHSVIQRDLGEDGQGLSGGQKHRVAVACAMAKKASLLLLDEPTAYLDYWSEKAVLSLIQQLPCGTTVLFATHRPETLALSDRILWVGNGRVCEEEKERGAV